MALSQRNLVAGSYTLHCNDPEFMLAAAGLQQETTLAVLPMFHIYGLNVTMTSALHLGAKQVITHILSRLKHSVIYNHTYNLLLPEVVLPGFDPSLFVSALAAHRPTFLHVVPPLLSFLAHSPLVTPEHLASLRQVELGVATEYNITSTGQHWRGPLRPHAPGAAVREGAELHHHQGGLGHDRGVGRGHGHQQGIRGHQARLLQPDGLQRQAAGCPLHR